MHRQPLLALLARHQPAGDHEADALEQMVTFVRRQPSCFLRTLEEGHVTASAWILDHTRERCLLAHHRKLGRWLQCGGHADGDPDVLRVARREAFEESGIAGLVPLSREIFDVDVHHIPAGREPAHLHYDVRFALAAPPGARPSPSDESHALAWVRRHEVERYDTDESVLRLAGKWAPARYGLAGGYGGSGAGP